MRALDHKNNYVEVRILCGDEIDLVLILHVLLLVVFMPHRYTTKYVDGVPPILIPLLVTQPAP